MFISLVNFLFFWDIITRTSHKKCGGIKTFFLDKIQGTLHDGLSIESTRIYRCDLKSDELFFLTPGVESSTAGVESSTAGVESLSTPGVGLSTPGVKKKGHSNFSNFPIFFFKYVTNNSFLIFFLLKSLNILCLS